MPNTYDCLQTVVKNISGAALVVSAWPPHGRTFAVDEEVAIDGDLGTLLAMYRKPTRVVQALYQLFTEGKLQIIKQPNPILYDETADRTAMLVLDNDALLANDPCFSDTAFSSEL